MSCTSSDGFFTPYIDHLQAPGNNLLLVSIVTNHATDRLCTYITGVIDRYSDGVMYGSGTQYFSDREGPTGDQNFSASQTDQVGIIIVPPRVVHSSVSFGGSHFEVEQEVPGHIILVLHSWGDQRRSFQIDGCSRLLTARSGTDTGMILSLTQTTGFSH